MITEEEHKQYLIPAYIRVENIMRADYGALIEQTPGGPQLLKRKPNSDGYGHHWEYAGDVRQEGADYVVVLAALYDPETDSDVTEVHRGQSFDEAIDKLWNLRGIR